MVRIWGGDGKGDREIGRERGEGGEGKGKRGRERYLSGSSRISCCFHPVPHFPRGLR